MVEGTITGKLKAKNHVYLQNAAFNRSTNTLNITARNTGNTDADVEYAVNSDSSSFTGNLGTLSSGETISFTVNTDETFPLQNVSLNVEGQYFSNSQKQLKCTPTNGLVGYWPFNEEQTQNEQALDISGYQNNGDLNGGVETDRQGKYGDSYGFNGNDSIVEIQDDETFDFNKEITAYVKANPRKGGNGSGDRSLNLFSKRWGGGGFHDIKFELGYDANNRITWTLGLDDDIKLGRLTSSSSLNPNSGWHSIAGTYSSETDRLRIYIDSELSAEKTVEADNITSIDDENVYIGGGDVFSDTYYFDGKMYGVRLYNRSLTQPEITALDKVKNKDWASKTCKLTN
jgi:hypothetical protein